VSGAPLSAPREVLVGLLDGYMAALAAGEPSRAPLAKDVRFTENGQLIPIGHGLWATVTGLPAPRFVDVVDDEQGGIATLCQVEELGELSLLGLRLKGGADGITEIETLVVRPSGSGREPVFWEPQNLARPLPIYDGDAPAERQELLHVVNDYLDAIDEGSGEKVRAQPDALRRENGFLTVCNVEAGAEIPAFAMGMAEQIGSGFGKGIINRNRRYVVEAQRGLVFGSFLMEFAYSLENYAQASAQGWKGVNPRPTAMYILQVWKIRDGLVEAVDSVFDHVLYGMLPGWD